MLETRHCCHVVNLANHETVVSSPVALEKLLPPPKKKRKKKKFIYLFFVVVVFCPLALFHYINVVHLFLCFLLRLNVSHCIVLM